MGSFRLFIHALNKILVHVRRSLGASDKLVPLFELPLLVPLEVIAHLFYLLLRSLAGGCILFGQFLGRL